jgi:hypothetical protein
MKQKPLYEIENDAAQRAIEELYAIRPDLYTEELRKVFYHVAREGARTMTQMLTEQGYVATRTTGAPPPAQPAKPSPLEAYPKAPGADEFAATAIALALDIIPALLKKKPNA